MTTTLLIIAILSAIVHLVALIVILRDEKKRWKR